MTAHQSTVLLVEDDGDLRVALASLLAQAGYRVRTAWDGVSAMLEMELALILAPQNVSLSKAVLMRKGGEDDEVKAGTLHA